MGAFAYIVDAQGVREVAAEEALSAKCAFAWIHVHGRSAETESWLVDRAHLDPLIADALIATETRPRAEVSATTMLINMRGRSSEELRASDPLASLRLWAEQGRVISAARLPLVVLPEVRREMEAGEIRDPGDLIAALAGAITTDLDPEVGALGDGLDDCEEKIDGARSVELRRDVAKTRAQAIGYRRFVAPQQRALERVAEADLPWLDDSDRRHLRAAADRAARMTEELESIRERAALIHETLTDLRAETIDGRSLVIAIVAMVFLPLTFITGLFGMNVDGIPYAHHPYSFWVITGFCLLVSLSVAGWFVRERWFRN